MAQTDDLFELFDDDPSDETLEDITVQQRDVNSTVLYNTDWTVETILSQVAKRNIDLTPSFQRRDAWTVAKKSLFIESILLNFPIPPLTLAERGNSKRYIVVDGKQRISALSQFFGAMSGSTNNNFKLRGLQQLDELNGLDRASLAISYPSLLVALENYSIRTNVIRGWSRDDVLYSIFLRLNSGSVKLSPQELRQALRPGPFSDFMLNYAENSLALRAIFPGKEPDFRMRDLELLLRYLAFQFFLPQYRGQLKRFLDTASDVLNDGWAHQAGEVDQKVDAFERAYEANRTVFQDHLFMKWSGDRWENRLNRAVFDVQMFYLSDQGAVQRYVDSKDGVLSGFRYLCERDDNFRSAIESTTKSIEAVHYRLNAFGRVLRDLGVVSEVVELDENRMIVYG